MSAAFPEPPSGCLSGWKLSRAADGSLAPAERAVVEAHVASCARCAERLAAERDAFALAQDEALPDFEGARRGAGANVIALSRGAPRAGARRAWLAGVTVLALAALALLVTRPGAVDPAGGERAKGGAPRVEIAIERAGVVMAEPVAIGDAVLHAGDRMRLRVARTAGLNVAVEAFDAGQWSEIERGAIPEDGWLPLVLVVTAGDPARLRVLVCEGALPPVASPAASPTLVAGEGCQVVEHTFEVR